MALTNTELAQKVSDVADGWQAFVTNQVAWLSTAVATITVTDPTTQIAYIVKTPWQLQQDFDALLAPVSGGLATIEGQIAATNAALVSATVLEGNIASFQVAFDTSLAASQAAAAAAAVSQTAAGSAETAALTSSTAAAGSAGAAATSAITAAADAATATLAAQDADAAAILADADALASQTAATAAAASAAAASTSQTAASASATAAATSATSATASATSATASATSATASATSASTSQTAASTSATAAAASASAASAAVIDVAAAEASATAASASETAAAASAAAGLASQTAAAASAAAGLTSQTAAAASAAAASASETAASSSATSASSSASDAAASAAQAIQSAPAAVTQVEAEAGTEIGTRLWSPERVAQAIVALAPAGGPLESAAFTTDNVTMAGVLAGFRGVPMTTRATGYTFALADAGRGARKDTTAAHTYTIPPNSTVAFPSDGNTILAAFNNSGSGNISVVAGLGVTIRLAGSLTVGTRTIAPWGFAMFTQVSANVWLASGPGVT